MFACLASARALPRGLCRAGVAALMIAASGAVPPIRAGGQGMAEPAGAHHRAVRAGGATDLISRYLGTGLGQIFQQPFVVENRPGAAAMIGSDRRRARHPTVTLLMSGPASMVTNRFLYKKLSYDPDAFEKVAVVADTPNILLASPRCPSAPCRK